MVKSAHRRQDAALSLSRLAVGHIEYVLTTVAAIVAAIGSAVGMPLSRTPRILPARAPAPAGVWVVVLVLCFSAAPARAQDGHSSEAQGGQDQFWSHLKSLRFGPVVLDIGGQVRARYELDDQFTIKGYDPDGHHFALDQPTDAWYTTGLKPYRRDPTGRSGSTIGDELDLRVVWTASTHVELMGGYGRFFPGNFVENTGPAPPANWYFVQAAYSW